MFIVSVVAVAIAGLLSVDRSRIAGLIGRMKKTVLPTIALIFILDCVTPHGIAIPMLYAVPVIITSLLMSLEWSFAVATLVTALTYIGYLISPIDGNMHDSNLNRLVASILFWSCVLLGWLVSYIRKEIQDFQEEERRQ